MIAVICPECRGRWEVADELAGGEVQCPGCGSATVVPFDLPCEGEPAVPEAETLTLTQLQALKQGRG